MTGAYVRIHRKGKWTEDEIENLSRDELIGVLTSWKRGVNWEAKSAAETGAKWILYLGGLLKLQQENKPNAFSWLENILYREDSVIAAEDVPKLLDVIKMEIVKDV